MRFKEFLLEADQIRPSGPVLFDNLDAVDAGDKRFIYPISFGPKSQTFPPLTSFVVERYAAKDKPAIKFNIEPRLHIVVNQSIRDMPLSDFYKEHDIEFNEPYFTQENPFNFFNRTLEDGAPFMTPAQIESTSALMEMHDADLGRDVGLIYMIKIHSIEKDTSIMEIPKDSSFSLISFVVAGKDFFVVDRAGKSHKFTDGAILRAEQFWK